MARKSLAAPINGGAMPSKTEDDYRAEDDHRTMMRASEIKRDPTRMKGVARHHSKMTKDLAEVGDDLEDRTMSMPAPKRPPMKRPAMPRMPPRGRR